MGVTTTAGLPYPEPTDPIAAGANDIRRLAQAVDVMVQSGIANGTTNTTGDLVVTFPVAFATPPRVTATLNLAGGSAHTYVLLTQNVTATTFTMRTMFVSADSVTRHVSATIIFQWIAHGKAVTPAGLMASPATDDELDNAELEYEVDET